MIAAEWEAGYLPRVRIPAVATDFLVAGLDSPSLRVAAGLLGNELEDADEHFGQALDELGYDARREYRRRGVALAEEYGQRILDGRVPPYEGAHTIYSLSSDFHSEAWVPQIGNPMTALGMLCDEWEQLPDHRPELERQIVEQVRAFLAERPAGRNHLFPCPCCGFLTLPEVADGTYELCPVCYWEDDGVQLRDPHRRGGANTVSLRQARENFRLFGATERRFVGSVRPPKPEERP